MTSEPYGQKDRCNGEQSERYCPPAQLRSWTTWSLRVKQGAKHEDDGREGQTQTDGRPPASPVYPVWDDADRSYRCSSTQPSQPLARLGRHGLHRELVRETDPNGVRGGLEIVKQRRPATAWSIWRRK